MADILRFKKPRASDKHRGKSLCRSGFHKWEVIDTPFDVRLGRLVSRYRCSRCGATRVESR